jgi:hypothetical protein
MVIEYPSVVLHAISPDSPSFTGNEETDLRTIYLQLSATKALIKDDFSQERTILLVDSNADEDDAAYFFEMYLKPESSSEVERVYEALCECSSMNYDALENDSFESLGRKNDFDDSFDYANDSGFKTDTILQNEIQSHQESNSDVDETIESRGSVEKKTKIDVDDSPEL